MEGNGRRGLEKHIMETTCKIQYCISFMILVVYSIIRLNKSVKL